MSVSTTVKKRFQLYGYFDNDEWKDGILAANFRYFSALPREGETSRSKKSAKLYKKFVKVFKLFPDQKSFTLTAIRLR